jgi:hypothetical protein
MLRRTILIAISVAALSGTAAAQEGEPAPVASGGGEAHGFGVGAEAILSGPAGIAVAYDMGRLRFGGLFAFSDSGGMGDPGGVLFGGRIFLPIHRHAAADLSVGGGAALALDNDNDTTVIYIEGLGQIRAFIVQSVAVQASAGLVIATADGDDISATGQVLGTIGVIYYFR